MSVDPPAPAIKQRCTAIDRHFASDQLEDILASLAEDAGEWAQATLATLRKVSPQACKVTLRQIAEAKRMPTFTDEMAMEYRIAARVLMLPDFSEGVRALLIDKTNDPHWTPAMSEAVTDAAIDAIFAPLPAGDEWRPLA